MRVTPDTLVMSVPPAAGTLAIPRANIEYLSVSRGMSSRAEGAGLGVVTGVLAGALLGGISSVNDDAGSRLRTVGVWSAGGAAFGMLWGALWPAERWKDVPARVSFLTPGHRHDPRVGLEARVEF